VPVIGEVGRFSLPSGTREQSFGADNTLRGSQLTVLGIDGYEYRLRRSAVTLND
jgi:hypothetical protein